MIPFIGLMKNNFFTKSCFLSKFIELKLASFLGLELLIVSFNNNDQFSEKNSIYTSEKQNLKENLCPFHES